MHVHFLLKLASSSTMTCKPLGLLCDKNKHAMCKHRPHPSKFSKSWTRACAEMISHECILMVRWWGKLSPTMIYMSFMDERTKTKRCAKLIGRQRTLIISIVGYPWRERDFSPEAISFFYLWLRHHETLLPAPCQRTIEISTKRVSPFLWLDLKFQDLTSRLILTVKNESNSPVWTGYIRIQWIWCQLQFRSTTLSHLLDRSC